MLHVIAFLVIGIIVGAAFIRRSHGAAAAVRVIGGLVGSLVGGFVTLLALGTQHTSGKYGSIVVAIVIAVAGAAIAARGTSAADAR